MSCAGSIAGADELADLSAYAGESVLVGLNARSRGPRVIVS